MPHRRRFALVLPLLALAAATLWSSGGVAHQEDPCPHADHQGLFPVCTGCHAGISTDRTDDDYPRSSQCVGCHDGQEEERVTWTGPSEQASNVVFEHSSHATDIRPT